ncbi:Leucine--tRNA ligase [Dirofilaria immitis]
MVSIKQLLRGTGGCIAILAVNIGSTRQRASHCPLFVFLCSLIILFPVQRISLRCRLSILHLYTLYSSVILP